MLITILKTDLFSITPCMEGWLLSHPDCMILQVKEQILNTFQVFYVIYYKVL